jgi:branched-chain amino acid transport system substrate-binding protein
MICIIRPTPIIRAVALVTMALFGSGASAEPSIKIGLIMPMTGALASNGKQIVAAAKLYMQQHGDSVAGKKIELIVRDDGTLPDMSKRITQELLTNEKVDIIGGGITAGIMAIAPLVTETKTPTVVMLSGSSIVTEKSPYIVRTSFTLEQSSVVLADWAAKNGIEKVVTIVSDFAPGYEAEAAFKQRIESRGGHVIEALRVPLQNPDFAPFLQRAQDAKPQALFVFVPAGQGAVFAKQFLERGLDQAGIKLIGPGDVTDDDVLPNMGDAMIGTVTAHFYSAAHPSPANKAFVEAFEAQYKYRPNFMAVSGYDGMNLIYEALRKTNGITEGDALVTAMKGMHWESPRGPMSIDPVTRDVVDNVYMRRVEKVKGELYNVEFAEFGPPNKLKQAAKQ